MTTPDPTVAIMSPGDMGHAVAAMLRGHGLRVITCLEGRSARTRALAEQAGIEAVADDDALVREADLLLSILVPAEAERLARRIAAALERTARRPPLCRLQCDRAADRAPDRRPGRGGGRPLRRCRHHRAAAQGRHAHARSTPRASTRRDFAALRDFGLDVRPIGARPGDASAVKMCYAALTKGTTALMTELSVAAERLGVSRRPAPGVCREPAGGARAHGERAYRR